MASYRIEWKRSAVKELKSLHPQMILRVTTAVTSLATDPFPAGVTKLSGSQSTYRIRVGDYRVIYTIEADRLLVEIVRVGHRRDVYR